MLDDVSPDLYGAHGLPQAVNTPNVDKLASEGVMFKTCYASAMCGPSRVQIMTGKYGSSTGVTHNSMWLGDSNQNVYKDHQAFGKLLKDAGYATAIAGKYCLLRRVSDMAPSMIIIIIMRFAAVRCLTKNSM